MTRYGIFIIGAASGKETPFDRQWVTRYDPQYVHDPGRYDGGVLETSPFVEEALRFDGAAAALEKWREVAPEPFSVRPDGRPNRPLSAFTVEVLPLDETPSGPVPMADLPPEPKGDQT